MSFEGLPPPTEVLTEPVAPAAPHIVIGEEALRASDGSQWSQCPRALCAALCPNSVAPTSEGPQGTGKEQEVE